MLFRPRLRTGHKIKLESCNATFFTQKKTLFSFEDLHAIPCPTSVLKQHPQPSCGTTGKSTAPTPSTKPPALGRGFAPSPRIPERAWSPGPVRVGFSCPESLGSVCEWSSTRSCWSTTPASYRTLPDCLFGHPIRPPRIGRLVSDHILVLLLNVCQPALINGCSWCKFYCRIIPRYQITTT
jgi:hypothetical protein